MNVAKKTPRKTKIALKYTAMTKNHGHKKSGFDTMSNISIDTPC